MGTAMLRMARLFDEQAVLVLRDWTRSKDGMLGRAYFWATIGIASRSNEEQNIAFGELCVWRLNHQIGTSGHLHGVWGLMYGE